MSKKYLDDSGLSYFWEKVKAKISGDILAEAGKLIPYGYCQTAKGTKAKTVTVSPAITELKTGLIIAVRFQYENTIASPTLNVNSLGAKSIYRYGTTAPSTSAASSWNAGSIQIMIYNGSAWILGDWNNTTYSSMTVAEIEAGTGTTARTITPARLKEAIEEWSGGSTTETDPIYSASPAAGIASIDISHWNESSQIYGIGESAYPIYRITKTDASGVSGIVVSYDDGTTDGGALFFADSVGLNAVKTAIESSIPTATSELTNDSGFITSETDPTVPSWAKASTKPSYTASEVGALSTGGGQVTGDVTLYVASGNSPAIIFQRGTLTDNYNDWKIYDKSGFLYFAQRGNGSSDFGDVGYIDTGGVLRAFTIPWGSVTGKPAQLPTVTTSDNGKVLRVVDGAWSAVALPSASGVSF